MTAVLRVGLLVCVAVLLGQCAGAKPCNDIPEASAGPCRVGLPPDWDTDSSRFSK